VINPVFSIAYKIRLLSHSYTFRYFSLQLSGPALSEGPQNGRFKYTDPL